MENNDNKKQTIETLLHQIEEMIGMAIRTPKDFSRLRTVIYNRTGQLISITTLKRIWGYINYPVKTRKTTLSILTNCLGYNDWDHYCKHKENLGEIDPSTPILGRRLSVLKDLKKGDLLKLTWHPERKCIAVYLGDGHFEVVESEKTRLKPGDTFSCHIIISGYPLYLSELKQDHKDPIGYICGRGEGGVRFEIL